MLRTAIATATLVFATVAQAQDIGGTYDVAGTNFDGSRYGGTAEIKLTSETTCQIVWETGSTARGICMRNGSMFSAGYVMGDAVGLVLYRINTDGSLEGLWTVAGQDGVGTETLTPR